jgi:hypothetical protein
MKQAWPESAGSDNIEATSSNTISLGRALLLRPQAHAALHSGRSKRLEWLPSSDFCVPVAVNSAAMRRFPPARGAGALSAYLIVGTGERPHGLQHADIAHVTANMGCYRALMATGRLTTRPSTCIKVKGSRCRDRLAWKSNHGAPIWNIQKSC